LLRNQNKLIGWCQVSTKKESVPCPEATIDHQKNRCGVDKGGQIRAHGGGFSGKALCQQWHKKGFFAMLDMMLMNSLMSWNMAAGECPRLELPILSWHDFCWHIAQSMLNCAEHSTALPMSPKKCQSNVVFSSGHKPEETGLKTLCAVCKLDWNILCKKIGKDPPKAGPTRGVAHHKDCGITAHLLPCLHPRTIHSLTEFVGLTCFEKAHTKKGLAAGAEMKTQTTQKIPKTKPQRQCWIKTQRTAPADDCAVEK